MSFRQQLKPTTPSEPCPICQDVSGKCRHATVDTAWLCATHSSVKTNDTFGEFTCTGHSKDGFWGVFKINDSNWSEEKRRQWRNDQTLRREKAKREAEALEKEQKLNSLSAIERHQIYLEIREELKAAGLRADLRKSRGLSDSENAAVEVYRVRKYHQLSKKYDSRLPGLNKFDKSQLSNSGAGLIGFVRNADGLITGFQIRLDDSPKGGRYRWGSCTETPVNTKELGELPLSVIIPKEIRREGFLLTEGTIIKPEIAAEKFGMITIGASSGNFTGETFRSTIKTLLPEGTPQFFIAPDAGFAENQQVCSKLVDLCDWLCKEYGEGTVTLFDWNQICKSQGDIDEVDPAIIRELGLKDFRTKYNEALVSCKGFGNRFQNYLKNRKHLEADLKQIERYVSIPDDIMERCDQAHIRAQMGSGKTEAVLRFLKKVGLPVIFLGYRNSLSYATVQRAIDNYSLQALHVAEMSELIEGVKVNHAKDGNLDLIAGCIDSYHKMQAFIDANPEYIVVTDEVDSFLDHVEGGGTLANRQKTAIEFFKNCVDGAKLTFTMDANLNQRHVNLFKQLFPSKKSLVIDSKPVKPLPPKTFYFLETESDKADYSRNPKYLSDHLTKIAKEALAEGKKVLWLSDSQKSCETFDELIKAFVKGIKSFRFDGKTSTEKISKDFKDNPTQFITTAQLELLEVSPSGESGLDLSLFDYFDLVILDIKGVLGVNKLIQLSGRLRDVKPPVYVGCPEFSNATENPFPFAFNKLEEIMRKRQDMLMERAKYADQDLASDESIDAITDELNKAFKADLLFRDSLRESSKLKYEHSNLKLVLKASLAQDGHRIIDLVDTRDATTEAERADAKEFVKDREANQIFNAPDIDEEKAKQLAKMEVDWLTKCQVTKANFKQSLPGIEATESWGVDLIRALVVDNPKLIHQRWRLKQFESDELFNAVFKKQKEFNFEFGFSCKDVWKSESTRIEALKLMGFGEVLERKVFSVREDWVKTIINRYYENDHFYELIGITRAKKDERGKYIKTMVNRFLDFLGLECGKAKRKDSGDRYYPIVPNGNLAPFLDDIDSSLQQKAQATIEQASIISLAKAKRKGDNAQKQETSWNEEYTLELQKRKLEQQLTGHYQVEGIAGVIALLEMCDSKELARDVYNGDIPDNVLQLAELYIPPEKQSQISKWVFGNSG
ncbi:MAG: plasmid replication protein, CyRepA1 family [Cyanobacteria bacterium P01_C01_bin.38]